MFISSPLPLLLFSPSLFISTTQAALTYKGVDWSSLLVEERAGKIYRNAAGQQEPLEKILLSSGVNAVRQRIWNDPEDGNYNLEYNLELAQRAVESGLDVYLDFHYSDTWAGEFFFSFLQTYGKERERGKRGLRSVMIRHCLIVIIIHLLRKKKKKKTNKEKKNQTHPIKPPPQLGPPTTSTTSPGPSTTTPWTP